MENLPYVQSISTLENILERIKSASVPDRFSQDFVSTKLTMKGGTARAIIPFIKKMGLVESDGTPTNRYREYRNPSKSGKAMAAAMRDLYEPLFEMNEYAHELDTKRLKGLIVEATGADPGSAVVQKTVSTFQYLKQLADFEKESEDALDADAHEPDESHGGYQQPMHQIAHHAEYQAKEGINLSYTINLNLPATTDIEVFNAIFKSLKNHLLGGH